VIANDSVQINAKLSKEEKASILTLAKAKGCEGVTGLLKLLANAKEVKITL
jgi:hypothetical protein